MWDWDLRPEPRQRPAGTVAEASGTHIELARYVVQWDVMKGVGYAEELANLRRWYDRAVELQLTPELALDNYNCGDCAAPQDTAEYASELDALFRTFPDVKVLEAWDEPNDSHYTSYLSPTVAARLMDAAYSFCAAHGCTAIAGDLLDSEPNMVEYEKDYENSLQPRDPGNWGIHPYRAVKYMSDSTVVDFPKSYPIRRPTASGSPRSARTTARPAAPTANAHRMNRRDSLADSLIPAIQPAHVLYYEAAARTGRAARVRLTAERHRAVRREKPRRAAVGTHGREHRLRAPAGIERRCSRDVGDPGDAGHLLRLRAGSR